LAQAISSVQLFAGCFRDKLAPMMQGQHNPGTFPPAQVMIGIEMMGVIAPALRSSPDGSVILDLPPSKVKVLTNFSGPLPPSHATFAPLKPHDEFDVVFPELPHVVFPPGSPCAQGGRSGASTHRQLTIMDLPMGYMAESQLKTESPKGSLVVENVQVGSGWQRSLGQMVVSYKLQLDGQLHTGPSPAGMGASRLWADVHITFNCWLEDGPRTQLIVDSLHAAAEYPQPGGHQGLPPGKNPDDKPGSLFCCSRCR